MNTCFLACLQIEMAVNYLTLRSTIFYNTPGGTSIPAGYLNVASTNGINTVWTNNAALNNTTFSTLTGSTITSISSIGIGTSNPVYKLDVVGPTRLQTLITTGSVGIGTAAPAGTLHIYNSNAAFTGAPTVQIGDGQIDSGGTYGMLQLVRANNGADNKAHLAFIKNGLTLFGMGYYPGASQSVFGLVPSFGTMATNTGLWMTTGGNVGIGATNPSKKLFINETLSLPSITSSQDFPAQLALQSGSNWLKIGTYYQGGVGTWSVLQSSDYYSSLEHGSNIGLNPLNGKVTIGGEEMSGTATRSPGQALSRLTIHSDYGDSSSGFCINASDSAATNNYYMNLYPYVPTSGVVGYVFNTVNAGTSYSPFSINRDRVGINVTNPQYALDVNGTARVYGAGDNTYTTYFPNGGTWNATLNVGSGTNRGTAQVLTTDGNLHMDALPGHGMYYGYYTYSVGNPNPHLFYGGNYNFAGVPQNDSPYSQVVCMNGDSLRRSQAVIRQVYSSNGISWGGGVNISNAFYVYNGSVSVLLTGKYSGYWTSATTNQVVIRYQSVSTGAYSYRYLNTFSNTTYNHTTMPISEELYLGGQTGWFNLYIANNSGYVTDNNDQLQLNVILLPVNSF